MARLTGLEPATPGVTGRYSNQLSYNRAFYVSPWEHIVAFPKGRDGGLPKGKIWWVVRDSNSRHLRCKRSALPTELTTREGRFSQIKPPWQASFGTKFKGLRQVEHLCTQGP